MGPAPLQALFRRASAKPVAAGSSPAAAGWMAWSRPRTRPLRPRHLSISHMPIQPPAPASRELPAWKGLVSASFLEARIEGLFLICSKLCFNPDSVKEDSRAAHAPQPDSTGPKNSAKRFVSQRPTLSNARWKQDKRPDAPSGCGRTLLQLARIFVSRVAVVSPSFSVKIVLG